MEQNSNSAQDTEQKKYESQDLNAVQASDGSKQHDSSELQGSKSVIGAQVQVNRSSDDKVVKQQ